jgi:hypothetical protein
MANMSCHIRIAANATALIWPAAWKVSLNLVKEWKLEEFIATMRTGTDPGGHELSKQMPWRPIGKMDDEELVAVYEYLTHLPGS